MSVALQTVVSFLDETLRINAVKDYPNAFNGLQIENNGSVNRVAVAVDATRRTLEEAVTLGADLLIVHHGIFWGGMQPITGWRKKTIETALYGNLAIYAAHLPLDMHPKLGNNAEIARLLSLRNTESEIECFGENIGIAGDFDGTLGELKVAFERILGSPVFGVMSDSPDAPVGRIAVCSGAAAGEIYKLHDKGYRTYLTGEQCHWAFGTAEDMDMNILFGGHYATETFGVRALGQLLQEKFALPHSFIHHPTGV